MKLIVGLGNPGPQYEKTRHNIGAMVADHLVTTAGERWKVHERSGAMVAPITPAGQSVLVASARTYMNTTGEAVGPLAEQLGVAPERIIVVHDELDLPAGKVRVKLGGNENGHNGLKSITEHLGTRDYLRVRVGIGRPPSGVAVPDWVLGPAAEEVRAAATGDAVDAVRLLTSEGLQKAQNAIHAR